MAAALHHAQLVQGTKVLMVTSAMPGDGKSYTATNLALTLSESYRRTVLLIDADLRRPSLHEIFRVPNVSGLNEGLKASDDEPLSALKITETLTLLPAGRPEPDPMGGLSSPRMARIIQEGAARFDWVLIDTAPIGLLADAHLLATTVDGALLVVRANQTPYAEVAKALEALGRERVFGVVLNGAESSPVSSYSRYASAVPGPPAPTTPVAR
jgi:capsular exopolysaccharide synthesis family protein